MPETLFGFLDEQSRPRDPCRRAGDNPESAAAFRRVAPHLPAAREAVLRLVQKSGDQGATIHELCGQLSVTYDRPVHPNDISGRLTELFKGGLVYKYGRRGGAAVYKGRDV